MSVCMQWSLNVNEKHMQLFYMPAMMNDNKIR